MPAFAVPAPQVTAIRGDVVTPEALITDGAVVMADDRVVWVGRAGDAAAAGVGDAVADAESPAPGTHLLPGLVDLHNHGGGGAGFPDATTAEEAAVALAEHRRHGTTTLLASLVTAGRDVLLERIALLATLAEAGEIAGIHAEGPFLAPARRGAHDPEHLLAGDAELVLEMVMAGRGYLRTMTLAPDVPGVGGPDGILGVLITHGVVPSLGHTDCSTAQAERFIDEAVRGLRRQAASGGRAARPTATHLFNAMRPLHHREPGPVAACLAAASRGDLVVELVGDEVHLDPATVRTVMQTVGPDQVALVTDAMAAAGMADGDYELGPMEVRVAAGVARVEHGHPDGGAIAGSTAHLIDVVRATVAAGVSLTDAVRSASWVPAGVLGLDEVGGLVAGRRADVVVADRDLRVRRVLRAGVDV